MKKSIKGELVSLAHRILQLKEDSSYEKLTQEAREVYEKLTILAYAEKVEKLTIPTNVGLENIEQSFQVSQTPETIQTPEEVVVEPSKQEVQEEKVQEQEQKVKEKPAFVPVSTQAVAREKIRTETKPNFQDISNANLFKKKETVSKPIVEKINEVAAETPPAPSIIDEFVPLETPKESHKNDMLDIGGEYAKTPVFDKIEEESDKPKNLNDRLKAGLKVGLNDKLAFIKHLFGGNNGDYQRVVSQLETFSTITEAQTFVNQMVKPDYSNWEGKEEYEERFMQIVSNKFE